MKKKALVISLAIALVAILSIGGSLAWFSDTTDTMQNVFTVGGIKLEQQETGADGGAFVQNQPLYPVISETSVATDPNYIVKKVNVENIGESDAYLRTFIAVPTAIKDIVNLDLDLTGWTETTPATPVTQNVDGISYTIREFTYNTVLPANDDTATTPAVEDVTYVLLKGIWMDSNVDIQENAQGVRQFCTKNAAGTGYDFYDFDITEKVNVLVATQGCQAKGFTSATNALDTVFGDTVPTFVVA